MFPAAEIVIVFAKEHSLADSSSNIIYVDSDLFDLIPVLTESLAGELEEMIACMEKMDDANFLEKIHSSKGAALTFNFNVYAEELEFLRGAVVAQESDLLQQSLGRLNLLLKETSFLPLG